jgi:ABC-type Fe3+-siderophore transport system permease subunit
MMNESIDILLVKPVRRWISLSAVLQVTTLLAAVLSSRLRFFDAKLPTGQATTLLAGLLLIW